MGDFDYRMAVQLQQEFERESSNTINEDNQMALLLEEEFRREISNTEKQDKQMALLLQEQLERESTNRVNKDNQVALQLQEQFNHEMNVERPLNNLVYNSKVTRKNDDNTKSLVDPSWEIIDPTPNIHTLFMAFNEQYFWNKLLAVVVSWSTRMTSCAGICCYQGRGGMCSISLSEPLLKLRPRKDLVETLLHEMIHAYLFVTHNNKDRDGHGPEFHKHMHRINEETGTNITVYHDFHDEVKLYQQHWWKCNGPCQKWKPHYGIVRRAINRAPGPHDYWWGQHSRSCGGTFVKVKEPEKPVNKKKPGKENTKPATPKNDIRNYLPKVTTPPNNEIFKPQFNSTASKSSSNKIVTISSLTPIQNKSSTSVPSNATSSKKTFNDNAKITNIHGFHDIDKLKTPRGGTTTYNGGTVVVNKKPATSTITSPTKTKTNNTNQNSSNVFSGTGIKLGTGSDKVQDYFSAVKDKWLNKLETKTSEKRLSNEIISPKSKRLCVEDDDLHDHEIYVNCPVCNKKVKDKELNDHLDNCLQSEDFVKSWEAENTTDKTTEPSLIECDICNEMFNTNLLQKHKQTCLQNMSISLGDISGEYRECDVCKTKVNENIYNQHAESCLLKMFDEIDSRYDTKMVSCLVCKKQVPSSDLNSHLNECMSDSVFSNEEEKDEFCKDNSLIEDYENTKDSSVVIIEDDEEPIVTATIADSFINDNSLIEEFEQNKEKEFVICPVCNKNVPVDNINDHLDKCIN